MWFKTFKVSQLFLNSEFYTNVWGWLLLCDAIQAWFKTFKVSKIHTNFVLMCEDDSYYSGGLYGALIWTFFRIWRLLSDYFLFTLASVSLTITSILISTINAAILFIYLSGYWYMLVQRHYYTSCLQFMHVWNVGLLHKRTGRHRVQNKCNSRLAHLYVMLSRSNVTYV